MSENKTNPLLAGIVNMIPAVVNTVGSLVKNKKNKDAATANIMPALMPDAHNIANGIELSSKVVVGYGVAGTIITWALTKPFVCEAYNLYALGLGVLLIAITSIAKVFEK